jgi:hypothetical protein
VLPLTLAVRVPLTELVTVTVALVVIPLAAVSEMLLGEMVSWLEFAPVMVTLTVSEAVELSDPVMLTIWLYEPGASEPRFESGEIVSWVDPTIPVVENAPLTSNHPV